MLLLGELILLGDLVPPELGDILLGLGTVLLLLFHLSIVLEVLSVLDLLVGLLDKVFSLRLVLHLSVESRVLFFLH